MTELADVLNGPSGPHVVAFVDFDGTLIHGYSGVDFYRDRMRRRQVGPGEFLRNAAASLDYRVRTADITGLFTQTVRSWRGLAEQDLLDLGDRLFGSTIAGRVYPEAREIVAAHRSMGHTVVLATSATRYQVQPLATDLGVDTVLCTAVEIADGVVTGRIDGPILWGIGKAEAVIAYAAAHDIDLAECYGYGNGDEDIPFLEAVGHPRPLNPRKRLAAVAAERGWPIRHLRGRGRPGALDIARTGAALGAVVTALGVSTGIGLLNGDRRLAANLVGSLAPDAALALAGIRVEVSGEEHLWSRRPAVFLFNHQSALDVLIVGKLVRRDVTALAKKEAAKDPIFAPIGKLIDVAYVDRGNRAQTTAAIAPVLDRLAAGISVAIAPEGTRSATPRLGPFKKGAFHIALQARVPLVPIVIRNAGDLLWKGSYIARPGTLHVVVLPPVSTEDWTLVDLPTRIADVRQQFLDVLGHE